MPGTHQADIRIRGGDILNGVQQDMIASRMEDVVDPDHDLHQEDIPEGAVGAVAQQDPDVATTLARQTAGRRVRIVAELSRRLPYPAARFLGDLDVRDIVQNERDRGAGYARRSRHISAGCSFGLRHCFLLIVTRVTDPY
jgi:hypothetical protein